MLLIDLISPAAPALALRTYAFKFYGNTGGNLVWALKDSGSAMSGGNPVDMDSSLSFSLDDAVFLSGSGNIGLSVSFTYYKEENGRHLWMLDSFNIK